MNKGSMELNHHTPMWWGPYCQFNRLFAPRCHKSQLSSKVVYYMAPGLFDEFQAGTNNMMLQFGKEGGVTKSAP